MDFKKYRDCGMIAIWGTWLTTAAIVVGLCLAIYPFSETQKSAEHRLPEWDHCHNA